MAERIEVQRTIPAAPSEIFAVLTDPIGHVYGYRLEPVEDGILVITG